MNKDIHFFSSDMFLQKVTTLTALRQQASLLVPYSDLNSAELFNLQSFLLSRSPLFEFPNSPTNYHLGHGGRCIITTTDVWLTCRSVGVIKSATIFSTATSETSHKHKWADSGRWRNWDLWVERQGRRQIRHIRQALSTQQSIAMKAELYGA